MVFFFQVLVLSTVGQIDRKLNEKILFSWTWTLRNLEDKAVDDNICHCETNNNSTADNEIIANYYHSTILLG